MNKIKLLILMAGFLSWFSSCKEQKGTRDFKDDKFKVGQIWKYETRKGEENSTLEILKTEKYENDGIVIHIYVSGLNLKKPDKESGFSEEIGHLPFSKESILKSVTKLVSENNKLTDYKAGYENWKKAFDNNKGGIFSITVKEAVKYVEETMKSPKRIMKE